MSSGAEDLAKLKFDLANQNVQSVGHAQGKYVTALLTYIGTLWGLSLLGGSQISTVHLAGVDVPVEGIWTITPVVTLVLTLGYIGTVTAMVPALSDLREAEKDLFGSQAYSMFAVDTHKNVLDYLAILQFMPRGRTRTPTDDPATKPLSLRLHHVILPAVFLASAWTSYSAVQHLAARSANLFTLAVTFFCFEIQVAYTIRPVYRNVRRLFGAERTDDVYN